jgi:hypothetical protein
MGRLQMRDKIPNDLQLDYATEHADNLVEKPEDIWSIRIESVTIEGVTLPNDFRSNQNRLPEVLINE